MSPSASASRTGVRPAHGHVASSGTRLAERGDRRQLRRVLRRLDEQDDRARHIAFRALSRGIAVLRAIDRGVVALDDEDRATSNLSYPTVTRTVRVLRDGITHAKSLPRVW